MARSKTNRGQSPLSFVALKNQNDIELMSLAQEHRVKRAHRLNKKELILNILQSASEARGNLFGGGVLEIMSDGVGFLRTDHLLPGQDDVYVSQSQIRRFGLRTGDMVIGQFRRPKDSERYNGLLKVETVNDMEPSEAKLRPRFEQLTPIFPEEQLYLETNPSILATRLIDLLCPIGRGQRGLIVSPPMAGKTTILKRIANGITANHEDAHLIVLLIGERPEEVTDMERSVQGEVFSSTFDEPVQNHVAVSEMALERARRLVEFRKDVVILLDSITRLSRAYNLAVPPSGRTLSGGIDPAALYPPKKIFGTARNIEEGGSLTILATTLVDTGSRMDDMIYEEFKGTGNMELHLDRRLAERRIFPAIDVERSGTRAEEKLLDPEILTKVYTLRRMIDAVGGSQEAILPILERLSKSANNTEFLAKLTV